MSKMTDSDLNKRIKNAVNDICPDRAEELWEKPVPRAKGDEWYLDGIKKPVSLRKKILWMAPSIAACFMICFLFIKAWYLRTDATIYLDVNPSVELEINKKEKILKAEANNADGAKVLEEMDLEDTDLNVAVNAILGSMMKHGYLNEAKNMILLSVDSKDKEKAEGLRKQLSEDINSCLKSLIGSGVVFEQDIETDDDVKKLAEELEISPGKAALIQKITEDYPDIKYDELAKLPMSQLPSYLESHGINIEDYLTHSGSDLPDDDDDKDDIDDDDDDKDDADDDKDDDKDDADDDKDDADDDKDDADDDKDDDKDDADDDKDDVDDDKDDADDDKDDADDDKDDVDDDKKPSKPATGNKPSKPSGTVNKPSKPAKPSGSVNKPSKPAKDDDDDDKDDADDDDDDDDKKVPAAQTKPQQQAKPQAPKPQPQSQVKPQAPKPQPQPKPQPVEQDDDDDDYEAPDSDDGDDD